MMSGAVVDDDVEILEPPTRPKTKRVVSFVVGEAGPIG